MLNDDVLVVLYLRVDALLDPDYVEGVAACLGAIPFIPSGSEAREPSLVWLGNSDESASPCVPLI